MSDFELYSAFLETLDHVQGVLMNFVSVTFAFIVVGYFAGAKPDKKMVALSDSSLFARLSLVFPVHESHTGELLRLGGVDTGKGPD